MTKIGAVEIRGWLAPRASSDRHQRNHLARYFISYRFMISYMTV